MQTNVSLGEASVEAGQAAVHRAKARSRWLRSSFPAFLVLLVGTVLFFFPLLRGDTFSTVPGHQTAVFPWAATPSELRDAYPQSDQADLNYPWQTLITDALNEGTLPLWDPHSFGGGYPFFTNGSSAVLYPPRILAGLLLDPGRAHDLFSLFHVAFSGIAMYGFMREFRTGRAGSLLAAIAWMFCGFNLAWLHLEVVAPMSVFLPLVLLCVHRAFRLRTWTAATIAGLSLGAALISGHLILLGLVYLVGAGYAGALLLISGCRALSARDPRSMLPDVVRFAVIVGTSMGAAAVVLVPTTYALLDSQREPFTYTELTRSFLAPAKTFLNSFTPPPLPITKWRMHEMTFVGTVTTVFALVGLVLWRREGTWLGRGLLAASFLIAAGTPATWIAYKFIPGFNVFRPYSRLVVFWSFGLAALGGFGLDAVLRQRFSVLHPSRKKAVLDCRRLTEAARQRMPAGLALTAIVVTAGQLIWYGRQINPPFVARNADTSYPATPMIEALRREVLRPGEWPGRIMPVRAVAPNGGMPRPILFAAESLVFGMDTTGGYDSVVPRRVTGLMRILQGKDPEAVLRSGLPAAYAPTFVSTQARFELAKRLGVTTIAATPGSAPVMAEPRSADDPELVLVYDGPDGRVFRIGGAEPGPRLVHANDVVTSEAEALRRFVEPEFDSERSVIIESHELARSGHRQHIGTGRGKVLRAARGVNSMRVEVTTDAPAWLLLPVSWSPGWSASVDGRDEAVLRANFAKQAVRVPAGTATVELRYWPVGMTVGTSLSVFTIATCAVVRLGAWLRGRRSGDRLLQGRRRRARR